MFEQINRSSDVLSIFSSASTGQQPTTCFSSVRNVVNNIKSEKRDFLFDDTDTINSVENNCSNNINSSNTNNMNKIIMPDNNNDNSCCSDDSDLSVGKEVFDKEEETTEVTDSSKNKSLIVNSNVNPKHRVNEVLLSCASSCSEFATDADEEATDQDSGVNDSNQLCSNANNNNINNNKLMIKNHVDNIKEKIFANNLLFCDNSSIFNINSSPMKFQEDFLKSTQLYAETLMKQKLPIAACPKEADKQMHNDNAQSMQFDSKEGEASVRHNRLNFHNLHSHLNAITQIAHNLPLTTKTALPINVDLLSRENSMSPPNNVQHPYLTPHCLRMQQHNLNEQNLKFSIDNILKADFGRRITDPLLRNSSTKSNSFKETNRKSHNQEQKTSSSAASPIDLTYSYENNNSTNARPPEEKSGSNSSSSAKGEKEPMMWPAWIYCTRYSDRPSSGPRVKKTKRAEKTTSSSETSEDKRPRTAFSGPQLARLKHEFNENRYLTEKRRQQLSSELGLNEAQIKIWFQNKRAKIKKSSGQKNPLALQLMAQGLYNHSTVPLTREEEELQESNS